MTADARKKERLAAALRENLKRRKARQRSLETDADKHLSPGAEDGVVKADEKKDGG